MAKIEKFDRLCGYAFENALRYHFDSIDAYKRHSFATAYQLSLLASEELGKAIMLEEYVWQYYANGWREDDPHTKKWLESIFTAHKTKQGWFARSANDFINNHPNRQKISPIIRSLFDGLAEEEKQKSTYVGLTKKGKKVDLNGKIIIPRLFAQPIKSEKQITLNNDFLTVYISGFLRGIYGTDSYSMAQEMTLDYLEMLLAEWEKRSRTAKKILKEHEAMPFEKNPLSNWEE